MPTIATEFLRTSGQKCSVTLRSISATCQSQGKQISTQVPLPLSTRLATESTCTHQLRIFQLQAG